MNCEVFAVEFAKLSQNRECAVDRSSCGHMQPAVFTEPASANPSRHFGPQLAMQKPLHRRTKAGTERTMAKGISIKKAESIFNDLKSMQDRITQRAYDIFENSGRALGRDLEHWLNAERELVWKPVIELSEKDETFHVSVAIPGVDPKALDIEVAPDYLLIKAEIHHQHRADQGTVHVCEFEKGSLFRSIRFPKKVDPNKVQAEFKNGMLFLTAEVAEQANLRKIQVKAS